MNRAKRIAVLLGVLLVLCAAAVAVLRMEGHQEQIKTSGEVVLQIDPDAVQSLSWDYNGQTFSFHRDGAWSCDSDAAFPVDEQKITSLLTQFEQFGAVFTISDVQDYAQYGLSDPLCTISIGTSDTSYEISLGDYSSMDSLRYISFGDGNVYLAAKDPLDEFDLSLRDLILNDQIPDFDQVTSLTFSGAENYSIFYEPDSTASYSADDVYFTEQEDALLPLDSTLVETYLSYLRYLDLTDYVSYNTSQQELQQRGLEQPELTLTVEYTGQDEQGEEASGSFVLHLGIDPQTLSQAEEQGVAVGELEDGDIVSYVRVGDSAIVYQLTPDVCRSLLEASCDNFRHRQVLWADWEDVTQLDILLEGEQYTISSQGSGEDRTYLYDGQELDTAALQDALAALRADEFVDTAPSDTLEISLTVSLDNEQFPTVSLAFYRYDGTHCLAVVDGEPVSLVPRSDTVDLTEAVRALVWSS